MSVHIQTSADRAGAFFNRRENDTGKPSQPGDEVIVTDYNHMVVISRGLDQTVSLRFLGENDSYAVRQSTIIPLNPSSSAEDSTKRINQLIDSGTIYPHPRVPYGIVHRGQLTEIYWNEVDRSINSDWRLVQYRFIVDDPTVTPRLHLHNHASFVTHFWDDLRMGNIIDLSSVLTSAELNPTFVSEQDQLPYVTFTPGNPPSYKWSIRKRYNFWDIRDTYVANKHGAEMVKRLNQLHRKLNKVMITTPLPELLTVQ